MTPRTWWRDLSAGKFSDRLQQLWITTPPRLARILPRPTGNAERGRMILGGRLVCAGSGFDPAGLIWHTPPETRPQAELHGFTWLIDLAATQSVDAQTLARRSVTGWIDAAAHTRLLTASPLAVTGNRIATWLSLAEWLIDPISEQLVFDSLRRQIRHLLSNASALEAGIETFTGAKALLYAGLCGFGEPAVDRAFRLLEKAVTAEVLPDGGHIGRSPALHLRILTLLVECRGALEACDRSTPAWLASAIGQLAGRLPTFQLGDGTLALFNGTSREDPAAIKAILKRASVSTDADPFAADSGFIRMAANQTVIVADVGGPPPAPFDRTAHAGTLSFELSHGAERIIVNCGAHPAADPAWLKAQRATAAHSTLVFADTNSSETLQAAIGRRPGKLDVTYESSDGESWVSASHDGYQPLFGLIHRRRFYLSGDGTDIRGEDALIGPHEGRFAIRFHLHPDIQASLVQNAAAVLLRAPSGTAWRMQIGNAVPALSESIYLADPGGPRRTEQIVLGGSRSGGDTVIKWAFRQISK